MTVTKTNCLGLRTKNLIVLLILLTISFTSMAQVEFEKGYFLNNEGQRSEVLIKNLGWLNNPSDFIYKTDQTSATQVAGLENVSEFGVPGKFKYVRARVGIDRAKEEFAHLNRDRSPDLQEETLFLKTMIEGEGILYGYRDNRIKRFFFSVGDLGIDPLIYKKYIIEANKVGENNRFRNQLYDVLKCETLSASNFQRLSYQQKDFVKIFKAYNACKGSEMVDYLKEAKSGDLFDINLKAGGGLKSTEITQTGHHSTDVGARFAWRAGVEFEFTFPFLRNKWSLFFEPSFYQYNADVDARFVGFTPPSSDGDPYNNDLELDINYQALALPLGIRHHFFLEDKNELFLNAGFSYDLTFDTVEVFKMPEYKIDLPNSTSYFLGLGYSLKGKYSAELRVMTGGSQDGPWQAKSTGVDLILGYNLF